MYETFINMIFKLKHYDALRCKFRQIEIYNLANYLRIDSCVTLNLLLSNSNLPVMLPSITDYINYMIIDAEQINKETYSGNIIQEVCNINTDLYNKEFDRIGNNTLEKICHQLSCQ